MGKALLITGGTGTVGQSVARYYLSSNDFDKIIIFSRDEFKQSEMRRELKDSRLRFILGDVRDQARLNRAMHGVDTVIHAAALKQIDAGAYNPVEFVRTNVDGSINVVEAAIDNDVRRVVAISTDKAVQPCCLYGATKLTMEGVVLNAKAYVGNGRTTFGIVRMGNIVRSRGSIIPFFDSLYRRGLPLPITSLGMTRYWTTQDQACELINEAAYGASNSIHLPDETAFLLLTLVNAYGCPFEIIGKRPQERFYEMLDDDKRSDEPRRWLTIDEIKAEILQ